MGIPQNYEPMTPSKNGNSIKILFESGNHARRNARLSKRKSGNQMTVTREESIWKKRGCEGVWGSVGREVSCKAAKGELNEKKKNQ